MHSGQRRQLLSACSCSTTHHSQLVCNLKAELRASIQGPNRLRPELWQMERMSLWPRESCLRGPRRPRSFNVSGSLQPQSIRLEVLDWILILLRGH